MTTLIDSIRGEYLRYRTMAESAIAQLDDPQLGMALGDEGNSVGAIVWHVSGNLASRFTDFLTTDGEKPWRNREEEFASRQVTNEEVIAKWETGWKVLNEALDQLTDNDLMRKVTIRGKPLLVCEALHRSLAHTASHVGQIVLIAKTIRGRDWNSLSIPRGYSDVYNSKPTIERPSEHSSRLTIDTAIET